MLNQNLNNKGQALVEFVIILPIIMMIIFIIIDFSNIFYQKNNLESVMSSVVSYKENKKTDEYIQSKFGDDVNISYNNSDGDLTIYVSKKIKLITPFSSIFFDNPYEIVTERTIVYE